MSLESTLKLAKVQRLKRQSGLDRDESLFYEK